MVVRRLRVDQVRRERFTPGRSLLLFMTDRCPVGCGHCSVDSRPDSPRIRDFALFERLVDGICAEPDRRLIGISGGEPFVERRGLTLAMRRLAAADKDIVLYTSGVWARRGRQPEWITELLPLASCVFLSTDAYHADNIDDERYAAAARAVAEAGVPIAVQVIDVPEQVEAARHLLTRAFGPDWQRFADLTRTAPLAHGRGADLFAPPPLQPGATVGSCSLLTAPVVRYDGQLVACCNESVIMGRGPQRLRQTVRDAAELRRALADLDQDALLGAIATVGAGTVTALPEYSQLAAEPVRGLCDLCWRLQAATARPLGDRGNRMLTVLPLAVAAREGR